MGFQIGRTNHNVYLTQYQLTSQYVDKRGKLESSTILSTSTFSLSVIAKVLLNLDLFTQKVLLYLSVSFCLVFKNKAQHTLANKSRRKNSWASVWYIVRALYLRLDFQATFPLTNCFYNHFRVYLSVQNDIVVDKRKE